MTENIFSLISRKEAQAIDGLLHRLALCGVKDPTPYIERAHEVSQTNALSFYQCMAQEVEWVVEGRRPRKIIDQTNACTSNRR